jgi:hypothetical protein
MNKNRIRGRLSRTSRQMTAKSIVIKDWGGKSGRCAGGDVTLT